MIKPSDFLDAFDKTADIINLWTDFRRQEIIDEILWLDQNYKNIDALRGYILKRVDFINKIMSMRKMISARHTDTISLQM